MVLSSGPVNYLSEGFPSFVVGGSHLQFLRDIPESGAYPAIEPSSTLLSKDVCTVILRKIPARSSRLTDLYCIHDIYTHTLQTCRRTC